MERANWVLIAAFGLAAVFQVQPLWSFSRTAFVDERGVLRWRETGEEVALFGVNYYAPFASDYFFLKQLGVPIEQVIDCDVLHFARMGLDVIRLHVFDREISDREGNLLDNEHLRLLDYLIAKARERGIYVVLTPIAWWGTPNPNAGFSNLFTMQQMTTDPIARRIQQNYLVQFVTHVNRYTGLAYKDDPVIIAFELINEPLYPPGTTDEQVRDYINALAQAIRQTGCQKPLFYNGWGNRFAAVRDSVVEGCSFGWYPTGLVARRSLKGNFLPLVDDYPSMRAPELARKAKIVYEFDAADVPGSYIYPAMARAFRSGGAQIATQFQYDPLPLAPFNVGWQTHYLNLVYSPNKAVSFIIAAEAFRRLPRLKTYGRYPESTRFGPFRVSYEEDLSEMVTEREFFYSNDTKTVPPAPEKLTRIIGCGSSPVVRYDGTGAYFLDKLSDGVWRLEVYPDAVWVNDPYGNPRLDRYVSVVFWRERTMQLRLPDLGAEFSVEPLNEGNAYRTRARNGVFRIRPGAYLLRRHGAKLPSLDKLSLPVRVGLHEFVAPPSMDNIVMAWHEPARLWVTEKPLPVTVTVATSQPPQRVVLHFRSPDQQGFASVPMKERRAYRYEATIPAQALKPPKMHYCVSVHWDDKVITLPANLAVDPAKANERWWQSQRLFAAEQIAVPLRIDYSGPEHHTAAAEIAHGSQEGVKALRLTATGFGEPPSSAGVRLPIAVTLSIPETADWVMIVKARTLYPQTTAVEIGLVERDGSAFGADVPLTVGWRETVVPSHLFRPLWGTKKPRLQLSKLAILSIVFGAWLYGRDRDKPHGLEIESVAIAPALWEVAVQSADEPIALFDAERHPISPRGDVPVRVSVVPGMMPDRLAVRIAVNGFGPPPSSIFFRNEVSEELALRHHQLAECDTLLLRARAVAPETTQVEVVVIERDGTPWGTNVPLSTEWQEIRIPLSALRHFAHWRVGRSNLGDQVRPENIVAVNVCFGAWLFPNHAAKPHAIEIEHIALVRSRKR